MHKAILMALKDVQLVTLRWFFEVVGHSPPREDGVEGLLEEEVVQAFLVALEERGFKVVRTASVEKEV